MKRLWLGIVMTTCLSLPVKAQVSTSLNLPILGSVDLSNLIANTGPILAYDNHGTKWAGANVRVLWWPADPTQAWGSVETGVLWDAANGVPAGVTSSIGFRLDTLAAKIGAGSWVKANLGHVAIPSLEIGPWGGYLSAQRQWVYGAFISKKIGG